MTNTNVGFEQIPAGLRRNWGWLFGLGVLFIVLGCIGLGMVVGLTLASMLFFGVLLIIAGLSQVVDVLKSRHWKAVVWHAFIAIFYLIAGSLVIYEPFLASALITAMLGGVLILIGLTRFIMAIILHNTKGWFWLLLAGLTAIVLGVLIIMQWPWSGLWVIGLFIAIEMIVNGWSYIFISLAMRHS